MHQPAPLRRRVRVRDVGDVSFSITGPVVAGSSDTVPDVETTADKDGFVTNSDYFGIVLLHGWSCRSSDFDAMIPPLARDLALRRADRRYHIIAPDLPGHGDSAPFSGVTNDCKDRACEPTIAAVAQAVLQLITQSWRLKRVVLVGHSLAGRVVAECWRATRAAQESRESEHDTVNDLAELEILGIVLLDCGSYRFRPAITSSGSTMADAAATVKTSGSSDKSRSVKADPPVSSTSLLARSLENFKHMFHPAATPPAFQDACLEHIRSLDQGTLAALRLDQVQYDLRVLDDVLRDIGRYASIRDAGEQARRPKTKVLNIQSSDILANNSRVGLQKDSSHTRWMTHLDELFGRVRNEFGEDNGSHSILQQIIVENSLHFPHVDHPGEIAALLANFVLGLG